MKDISQNDVQNNVPLVTRKHFLREVRAGAVELGGNQIVLMAGPCTVESREQIFAIAQAVKEAGATMLRGGVFKPLTFPYGDPLLQPDRGSGLPPVDRGKVPQKSELLAKAEKRYAYLKEAGAKYNLPIISELLYSDAVDMMEKYVDMFQIGYRHMFNMDLIEALAVTDKPIMIKRHYGESLRSLLGVAEHFEARGKHNFVVCERGVAVPHTHNVESRAIIDIQAVPALKEYCPSVPVFVDPSHATFKRTYVPAISRAAIAAGADGLLIEVHPTPEEAWVDPLQALNFADFADLVRDLRRIAEALGRTL